MVDVARLESLVDAAYAVPDRLESAEHEAAVYETIEHLDKGRVRAAARGHDGAWVAHPWVARAILLYFRLRRLEICEVGPFTFHDKIPLKRDLDQARVRVVPPGTVRYGAFLEPGVVLMPGYVNIGAYVGAGTMVDTWSTVGSCAQVGRDCHVAGGAGIGGVLEPPGARPVIIEDGVFIGSRAVVVEGVLIEREAVIGANVVLTASTRIIDVTGSAPVEHRGRVPSRSVVIPGARLHRFPAGEYGVPCALVIGQRSAATDRKVSLEQALRDYEVPV